MVLVLALLKVAVPFALISCYSTPYELKHALGVAKVTRLFVAPQYISKALPVARGAGVVKEFVYGMNSRVEGHESLEVLVEKVNVANIPRTRTRIVPKDTPAYLLFSSGTTGLPKGTH